MSDETTKPGKGGPVTGVTNVPPKSEYKPKGNTIPVDRDQFAQILRDNEEFRVQIGQLQSNAASTQQGGPMIVKNRKKETLIKVRRWNDKYVIGWENIGKQNKPVYVYKEYNAVTREDVLFINLILEGEEGKKPTKVEYLTYLQDSEAVFVKMLKRIEEDEEVIRQGVVHKKDFVENGYGMFETMTQVPVEVIIPHYTYQLQLEDGAELLISDRFVG